MSDVTVAPEGGAPSAAPSTHEVAVNENQTNAPNPVTGQAPEKPPGEVRPEGRKEAIQRAFERANNPPPKDAKPAEKPAAKPAEAKPGHNNPPEETPKLDLKKRPADQPHREQGRFARAPDAPQASQQQRPREDTSPYRTPPSRFSEAGKKDWAQASDNVRADVYRMHADFDKAYKQYRGDHEAFNPIRHYHKMATDHGTTLDRALANYTSMERKLRADPIGGLDVIVSNLNLQTPEGQKLTLRDIAYHVLSQTPDQLRAIQSNNVQGAQGAQLGALHQEIAGLKNTLQQMHTQQQFTYTRSAVEQFANDHPRFDELGVQIEQELKLGFDLETAYRRAELLRPATHAAQTRSAPAQTRTADKSISGAPDVAPSNGASRRSPEKQVGRRDAIENAIRRVGGGV